MRKAPMDARAEAAVGKMFYRQGRAANEKLWARQPRPLSLSSARDLK
ncbi:hypothetical protein EKH55_0984 [Sinorhizobium alkalisoli]|nr:hypothetical protein EKH55_0984 [Sinorhizobium alkalisoli]